MRDHFDAMAEVLRESHDLPLGWKLVSMGWIGGKKPEHWTHMEMKGAVYPLVTRGKRKGYPNYRKPDPATNRTIILSAAEFRTASDKARKIVEATRQMEPA